MTLEFGARHAGRWDASRAGTAVSGGATARGYVVHGCPFDLMTMRNCPYGVMLTDAGSDDAPGVCVYLSVAKTDRGLDFVCHHPRRRAHEGAGS